MDMEIINQLKSFYHKHQVGIKKISFFLKIIFTVLLFTFLVKKISFRLTFETIKDLPFEVLGILLLTTIIKFILQMHNWKKIVQIDHTVSLSQGQIFKTHCIGLLLKLLIPGGQGSFGKAFYLQPLSKKSSLLLILFEKYFQAWIFFCAGSLAAAFYFPKYMILFILIFLISAVSPYIVPMVFKKAMTEHKWSRYRLRLPYLYITQIFFLLITFYQYYVIIRLFYPVSIIFISKIVSLILGATLLPISYSGLGLRESVSALLFSQNNISAEIAVACSLTIFFLNSILPALPALFFIFRKRK